MILNSHRWLAAAMLDRPALKVMLNDSCKTTGSSSGPAAVGEKCLQRQSSRSIINFPASQLHKCSPLPTSLLLLPFLLSGKEISSLTQGWSFPFWFRFHSFLNFLSPLPSLPSTLDLSLGHINLLRSPLGSRQVSSVLLLSCCYWFLPGPVNSPATIFDICCLFSLTIQSSLIHNLVPIPALPLTQLSWRSPVFSG